MTRYFPCMTCKKAQTATRPGSRCRPCAFIRRLERNRESARRAAERRTPEERRAARARRGIVVPPVPPPPVPVLHSSIALYRVEKAKREARRAKERLRITAILDETRTEMSA